MRAFRAERRATLMARIISTVPSAPLGSPVVVPASTARAAASASMGSVLPLRYWSRLLGRITSRTCIPSAFRKRASPAPKEPVPSTPACSMVPNPLAHPSSLR